MRKFKFSLDGLLKLREFKETEKKTELGFIISKIEESKEIIIQAELDIINYLEEQDKLIEDTTMARDIQQIIRYIRGLEAKKVKFKEELEGHYKAFELKKVELAKSMADAKLIANLKGKKQAAHKKHEDKKMQQELEELFNMRKKAQ